MSEITVFSYKQSPVQFEMVDGKVMANATSMADVFRKRSFDWLKTDQTRRYIDAVSRTTKIVLADLVVVRNGGTDNGTWINEKLILSLARWLDVDFELWCDDKIAELLRTGSVSVSTTPSNYIAALEALIVSEKAKQLAEEQKHLAESKAQLALAEVTILAPKAKVYDSISNSEGLMSMNDAAKAMKIGRNIMMAHLRSTNVLMKNNTPYQSFIDSGYFKVVMTHVDKAEFNLPVTRVTGKGLTWLAKKFEVLTKN